MPCAAWAVPATSPMKMNSHVEREAEDDESPKAASPSATEPWMRKPTAKPTPS